MKLYCIIRRKKSEFISGAIFGILEVSKDQQIDVKGLSWNAYKYIRDGKSIKGNQFTPLDKYLTCHLPDSLDDKIIEELAKSIKKFTRAHQVWIHDKSSVM